jgi:uncharacterized small protein (TIGR04563 family)
MKFTVEIMGMTTTDKRKRSLYFPDNILREMQIEAKRQERSLSWIVQYAWRVARSEMMRLPSVGSTGYRHEGEDIENEAEHESHHNHGFNQDLSNPAIR